MDQGGEKGDKARRPPRKRPPGHKGPWPPPSNENQSCEQCKETVKVVAVSLGTGYIIYKIVKVCVFTGVGGPVGFGIGVASP